MMRSFSCSRMGLGILIALSLALSGCLRFGNHTEESSQDAPPSLEGWYGTEPQTLTFCAGLISGTVCKDAPTNQIPPLLGNVMTNPVGLNLGASDVGDGEFVSSIDPDQQRLNTTLEEGGIINGELSSAEYAFFHDSACIERLYLTQKGAIKTGEGTVLGIHTIGRISVQMEMLDDLRGDCVPTLTRMGACYSDASQCGGTDDASNQALQREAQDEFNPYIEAGVLTAGDIPNVLNLGYTVTYQ